MNRYAILMVMAIGGLGGTSLAADDPPAPATPAAKPVADPDADALRGPTLAKHPDRPERSIVQRDFQGRLKNWKRTRRSWGSGS